MLIKILKLVKHTIIGFIMIVSGLASFAQTWSVRLVSPGKYEVNITPPTIMGGVIVNVTYRNANGQVLKKEDKSFTNASVRYLQPGNTYAKFFNCDNSVTNVQGNFIHFYREGSGDKADDVGERINENSSSTLKSGTKVRLEPELPVENVPIRKWRGWERAGGGSTDAALSVCEAFNVIYLFAKGLNDGGVYMNVATRNNPGSWRGWQLVPNFKTNVALASTVFSGNLYVFAKDENNRIFYNFSPINASGTVAWQGWQEIGGTTNVSLSATVLGNNLYLFGKGINDRQVYFNRLDNSRTWSGWSLIPGTFTTQMAVSSHLGPSTVNQRIWVLGVNENGEIFYNILSANNGSTFWTGWKLLPSGGTTDKPLAVAGNSQNLYLFAKGIRDKKIYFNTLTRDQTYLWSGWNKLEGDGTTDVNIAATGNSESRLILFTRGINDNRIYMNIHR